MLATAPAVSDPLPTQLQAELTVKVVGYDRNLKARAGDKVRIALVVSDSDADRRWAAQMKTLLEKAEHIAGLPHAETTLTYGKADDLAAKSKSEHLAIVILAASLGGEADRLRTAFDGVDVLTIAPDQDFVKRGAVLGFELVSGKPKLFLNLPQARRQNVALSPEVMKLMTVYQ